MFQHEVSTSEFSASLQLLFPANMFTVNPNDTIPIPSLIKIHYTLLGRILTRTHGYDENPILFSSIRNEDILLPTNDHHLYCRMALSSRVVCTSEITRFVSNIA
jgi:hypothetical protein